MRTACVLALALAACADAPPAQPSCELTASAPVEAGLITGLPTTELSGLAASHTLADVLWTHADSGGTADVYTIDTTGGALGSLHLAGVTPVDWEDIAVGTCDAGSCILVADIGDNDMNRAGISIYEIDEPTARPSGAADVPWRKIDISYPDGAHNAEALIVDPRDGARYLITKLAGPAALYAIPRTGGAATKLATIGFPAGDLRVTAADMFVDDCSAHILVRTRDRLWELRGPKDATVVELAAATAVAMPVAAEPQGEAVAFAADGSAYFTTSEGANPPLYRVDLTR